MNIPTLQSKNYSPDPRREIGQADMAVEISKSAQLPPLSQAIVQSCFAPTSWGLTSFGIILLKYAAAIKVRGNFTWANPESAYQLDVRAETETAYPLSHTATGMRVVNRKHPGTGHVTSLYSRNRHGI